MRYFLFITVLFFALLHCGWSAERASVDGIAENEIDNSRFLENVGTDWGGHVKARGRTTRYPDDGIYSALDRQRYLEGNLEARFTGELRFTDRVTFEAHYELVLAGGDIYRKRNELQALLQGSGIDRMLFGTVIDDDRRLFDLTKIISDESDHILYHRLDRLFFTIKEDFGVIRAGRQAVSWGNGLLFNPMDLFNPFAPTDIERDYKIGDDLLSAELPLFNGNLQALYVPRRNPETSNLSRDYSSLAAKYHFSWKMKEFDVMLAEHYGDFIAGLGSVGYVGGAAWRLDATWTHLGSGLWPEDYFSMVANLDYSWIWWNKNFYGFAEFFYSGIGKRDYRDALRLPAIVNRIDRGELYTISCIYLGLHGRVELHPLLNANITVISNLYDGSGVFQPRLVYGVTRNSEVLLGTTVYWGSSGTEFGGIEIPGTVYTAGSANDVFLWLSYYF